MTSVPDAGDSKRAVVEEKKGATPSGQAPARKKCYGSHLPAVASDLARADACRRGVPSVSCQVGAGQACRALFSRDYGVWGAKGPAGKQGKPVTLSPKRVREQCLFDENTCFLAVALVNDRVVGHAFYTRFWFEPLKGEPCCTAFLVTHPCCFAGYACWITQLCVDKDLRNQGIAKRLCGMVWAADDDVASGLITSHPYAVRALEAATGERCQVATIREHASALIAASGVPYVQKLGLASEGVTIDTTFFVDHSEINVLVAEEIKRQDGRFPWELGTLPDGHEFFAFTFHRGIGASEKSARSLVRGNSARRITPADLPVLHALFGLSTSFSKCTARSTRAGRWDIALVLRDDPGMPEADRHGTIEFVLKAADVVSG
jgi:GNAT superfamily N-acetyltransferase